ncbi:hypothetical protein [Bradyrhizobium sp. AUGA SZCCT0283]|uniref:hypothetical protein n=1 Tax=Bradyrhizobium sp. AUGA SZCCT0283 TaxID=2807671 RepID=UPI001BACDA7D|nr:hypothetical protein [Bradyrhizobium sp. AUGA SZCCT0283]MBR1275615.1 hypothetical protein [Bradyrhizobium sp. AUGA SZCCT0283]
MNDQRPRFLPSALSAIQKESEQRGALAIIPFVLIACACVSGAVAGFIPASFWSPEKRELSVAFYAGVLTFNGLTLALGWAAFSRIYDVLLRGEFGKYLMKNGLLNDYILHITYMHIFEVVAVVATANGLVSALLPNIPLLLSRLIFAGCLMWTAYAVKQAVTAVTAMNDLVWQAAFFEANSPSASGNVHSIR